MPVALKTTLAITSFNRGHLLEHNLERLCNVTKPDEILIVDDGGGDNTKEIVDKFSNDLPIRYIFNNNPQWSICSMARNIALKESTGDLFITCEPEMIFVSDVIAQLLEYQKEYPHHLISAGTIYHAQQNATFNPGFITDPVAALRGEIVDDYQIEPRSYHPSGYCKISNWAATFIGCYDKEDLMAIGGWDEAFPGAWGWDDVDLATRLRINGVNQIIPLEIQAIHQYHQKLPPHLQGEAMFANEAYMKSKRLNKLHKGNKGLIANKGKEFGVIK